MPAGPDALTLVVGAGAAGIAAARRLHGAGAEVLLLEARDRLGGRAWSLPLHGAAIDLGCGWLHYATRNPWTDIARARGFTIKTGTANWATQWRDLGFPPAEQEAFGAAYERWDSAARAALGGPDRPVSDFVDDERWRPTLDAISGYVSGAPMGPRIAPRLGRVRDARDRRQLGGARGLWRADRRPCRGRPGPARHARDAD